MMENRASTNRVGQERQTTKANERDLKQAVREVKEDAKRQVKELAQAKKAEEKALKDADRRAKEEAKWRAKELEQTKKDEEKALKEADRQAKEDAKRQAKELKQTKKAEEKALKQAEQEAKKAAKEGTKKNKEKDREEHEESVERFEKEKRPPGMTDRLFEGFVQIVLASPISHQQLKELEGFLKQIEGSRLVSSGGSVKEGRLFTLSAQEPIPLIDILNQAPLVEGIHQKGKKLELVLEHTQ